MTQLTSKGVQTIHADCLFKDDEPRDDFVKVEAIMHTFGFHPQRLETHREEIVALLGQLPETFREDVGGGWTFLNACQDKNGELWTGEHRVVEQLVALGIGIGKVEFCMPRELWEVLPGGMPYFMVKK